LELIDLGIFDKISWYQKVILICRSGNRSGQIAEEFASHNDAIYNMVGGMKAWKDSGLPMESENATPEVI